jgi:hypothetical protein
VEHLGTASGEIEFDPSAESDEEYPEVPRVGFIESSERTV